MKSVMHCAVLAILFMAQSSVMQVLPDPAQTFSGPQQDHQGPKQQQADKIRYQFHESEVPDGVVFQSLLTRVSGRYGRDLERTTEKVRSKMKFASDEEALGFIAVLDNQQTRLSSTKLQARKSVLCHSSPDRTRQQMFREVDTLSDINISLSDYAYDEFLASLDLEYSAKFSEMIDSIGMLKPAKIRLQGFRSESQW